MLNRSRTRPLSSGGLFAIACLSVVSALTAQTARSIAQVKTDADFAVIMDYETGAVLFDKNGDVPTAPASMSKLMTAAIVFEKLQTGELTLETPFFVSEKAWRTGGSKMWVRVDTEITVENLLRGIIIQSGNDACIVVAENIAGSEEAFADLMNRKAREWGLENSTFANPTGLPDPGQKMSTRDLASLARKIIRDYPDYYALFSEREFTWEKIRQENRNPILKQFDGADGLKTGHTDASGFGLVASAVKDGTRRIVVMNGLESAGDRAQESLNLLRSAFNDFSWVALFDDGQIVAEAEVFAGKDATVPIATAEPIARIIHDKYKDAVTARVVYDGPVAAPVKRGQQIGYLEITIPDRAPERFPLFATEKVKPVGFLGRVSLAAQKLLIKPPKEPAETGASAP